MYYEKSCLVLGILMCLTVISESRGIARRALSKDESYGNGEIPLSINPLEKGKKLGLKPTILGPPSVDEDYYYDDAIDPVRRPPENDYSEPERDVDKIDTRFPTNREWDERPQGNPKEKDDTDKSDDDNFNKPLDEEDSNKPGSNDKDAGPSFDEESPIFKDRDESGVEYTGAEESEEENSDKEYEPEEEEKPDEERKEEDENDDKEHIPKEEEKPDEKRKEEDDEKREEENDDEERKGEEEEKHEPENNDEERKEEEKHEPENDDEERKEEEKKQEPENDDEEKYVPEEELDDDDIKEEIPKEVDEETADHENDDKDDESISKGGEEGSSIGGSIFDTPFFNLERVKKYFGHLDRALGHVFSDTVDEALMLNGTVTNTTEEEVDIDGKKFIITKSLIKAGDNTSSIYVEALSAKPKMNDSKVMEDTE